MENYARVINATAIETSSNPVEHFHPDIASQFEPVPVEVAAGWIRDEQGSWAPPPEPEALPAFPQVGPTTFKMLWTSPERLALKELRKTDPVIDDFFEIIDDPRLDYVDLGLQSTQDGISYSLQQLANGGIITEEDLPLRRQEIFSGTMK